MKAALFTSASPWRIALLSWVCLALAAGCGRTTITPVAPPHTPTASTGVLTRPEHILVHDFAISADEISLDSAVDIRLLHDLERVSQTEEQLRIGHAAAQALAAELVVAIRKLGMPAQRADDASGPPGIALAIEGQIVSIVEGNSLRRVVIGLGVGATEVKTLVQVYALKPPGSKLWQSFETTAQSSRQPGMAETMGVGAAVMGARALAIGASAEIGSQYGESVAADARRTADVIANKLARLFADQGWIPADKVK